MPIAVDPKTGYGSASFSVLWLRPEDMPPGRSPDWFHPDELSN
jgi:hypothetical protein